MILNILLILFILFGAFNGYRKGLTTILVSLIGLIIAIVLAFMFKGNVANIIIEKTQVDKAMEQVISDGIKNTASNTVDVPKIDNTFYNSIIKNIGVSQSVDDTAKKVSRFLIETASFVIIFFIVVSCSFIIQMMLNLVFDLPVLSSINNIGGLAAGGAMAIIKIWIILALAAIVMPMYPNINNIIEYSSVARFLNDTNILITIISSGIKF